MKAIYAKRGDGLGTRMLSAVYARILADTLNCDMNVIWPKLGGVDIYDAYSLMHPDHLGELFENDFLFFNANAGLHGRILKDEDAKGLSVLSIYNNLNEIKELTQGELLDRARGHDGLLYDFPSPLLSFMASDPGLECRRREIWKSVNWNRKISSSIERLDQGFHLGDCVAVHIRRGDILDVVRRSGFDHLMADGMVQILQRYTPIRAFFDRVDAFEHGNIIVCTEDAGVVERFRDRYGPDRIICSADLDLSENQRAALDLILLSRSRTIIAPVLSFFSQCASDLGGAELINSAWHLQESIDELLALLADGDASRNRQISAILYAAAHKISAAYDPELASQFRAKSLHFDPAVFDRMAA